MNVWIIVGLIAVLGLFIYLFVALFKPEAFE
ncbi:MAG: K(+)-transporting ATPase subunit F [Thermodesulfobacteriota bacterium]